MSMRMMGNGSEGADVCHSVCMFSHERTQHDITCLGVCASVGDDSPRPGVADHLEVRGRLTGERVK